MTFAVFVSSKSVLIVALSAWVLLATLWMVTIITKTDNLTPIDCSLREGRLAPASILDHVLNVTSDFNPEATESSLLSERLNYYSSQIFNGGVNNQSHAQQEEGKSTLVIFTSRKLTQLVPKILSHYCKMNRFLQKIIVISSGDIHSRPVFQCNVDLKYIKSVNNKLTNRFLPREEIETDCVILIEDNEVISIYDVQFGSTVWQDFRHKIVGFEEKVIRIYPNQTFYYSDYSRRFVNLKSRSPKKYSKIEVVNGTRILHVGNKTYILGKESSKSTEFQKSKRIRKFDGYGILNSFFIHKAYLEMFFDPLMLPDGALKYVERLQSCESILMNIVVTKFLGDTRWDQNGALAVKNTLAIKHVNIEAIAGSGYQQVINVLGLGHRGHDLQRSECLEKIAQLYGYMPLHPSNTIATMI